MSKKLKIAFVSKLWEPTSPYSTGGTGMSVGNLVNGLVGKGHFNTLFATKNSKTKAQKLIYVKDKPFKNDYSEIKDYQNIFNAYKNTRSFDIIHNHIDHKACFFAPLVKKPSLITLRYGEFFNDELNLLKQNSNLNYSTISRAMTNLLPFIKFKKIIRNGIDLKFYPFNDKPKKYLLFLARLSPQKRPDLAVKIAKQLNLKLILAGKTSTTDKTYLENNVFKCIDQKQIVYQGEVGFKEKIKLLKNALCLIHPIDVFEAFGNSLIEAQACGTPVIAFNRGATPELIKHNQTGFVVKDEKEIMSAVKNIKNINRQDCRSWVEKNFTAEKMVAEYEKLYFDLIK